jgi:hypothetical protein
MKELVKDEIEVGEFFDFDSLGAQGQKQLIEFEDFFEKTENEIKELSENFTHLVENSQQLLEHQNVLQKSMVRC